ncbi:AAA domain-containing protein [Photorhabdus khanii]|uniref:Helicase n=1 Tax=Photorhabdus khanii subsp. guanajuatensis TaxID=2100166 RepID=A0A4V2X4P7_9GAMM|nr:AAA domain-containing protein [Photorhabdus khanii]TDB45125.1 helicase [Photorhabdus khanii subsp. guanajuatensis]
MVSVYMDRQDKTKQITDWRIWYNNKNNELMLTSYFASGKKYTLPMTRCAVIPTEATKGNLLVKGQSIIKPIERAETYGSRFTVIYYPGSNKPYVMNADEIEIISATNIMNEAIFDYFITVAKARINHAKGNDKLIAENVLRQMEKITPHPDTALHAYCFGKNQTRKLAQHFIYPFGVNESQLKAVEFAFTSQISIIEGPPGTGKTQTILNIIANILLNQKTVAILSNNNSAVENVYQKLAKEGLDYLVAKLGSADNRNLFFETGQITLAKHTEHTTDIQVIDTTLNKLKSHLKAQNQVALLQAQIDELSIEKQYLKQWQNTNLITKPQILDKYKLSPQKIADLLAYLNYLAMKRISFADRIQLLLNFRIIRAKFINDWEKRKEFIYALQFSYYENMLHQKTKLLNTYKKELRDHNFKQLLDNLTDTSMKHLKNHLRQHIHPQSTFSAQDYRNKFSDFTQRYPIIGSSTYSIINSIARGALLDYVIIDEASQQDIIPGILGLGCARNIIIVGDRKQLPHVPVKLQIIPPAEFYDCARYSLLDSFIGLFQNNIPINLLKEHYRCHPKIIQFCNKQFYDNQLIPMTHDNGEEALSLITTAKGNHTRNLSNLRELESLKKIGWEANCNTGYVAPYNNQINLSQEHLPEDMIKATTHKFQGRECDEIVFSTVLDKKWDSQKKISFVDDPHLINVAVSRAKNKFTLVTGDNVFTKNNQSIAALIRYIRYYANAKQLHDSPVISAFDLLYDEYDKSLEKLNTRLRTSDSKFKSEQIVAQLLREILAQEAFNSIKYHMQVDLFQLVSLKNNTFTPRELEFMRNRASCDFVLYFKMGKSPLGVIEADGYYHDSAQQAERDNVKNTILIKAGIPLLRLKTIDSNIKCKIAAFITGSLDNPIITTT